MNSILIIEDHPVMRKGLGAWFAGTGRWLVLGSCGNLDEAKEVLSRLCASSALPDIILLDIQLQNEKAAQTGLDLLPWSL